MKIEDQVCSSEPGKKLKELGVKQDSVFFWCRIRDLETDYIDIMRERDICVKENDYSVEIICSAFTVAELGEMLPDWVDFTQKYHNSSSIWYRCFIKEPTMWIDENKEADVRAKMLIYLLSEDCYYDDLEFLKWRNSITNSRKVVKVK